MLLVLAYGNSLRRDDGFAWEAARRLRSRPLPKGVEIRTLHQLTPELSLDLSECDGVVFVDASAHGTPGEIREADVGGHGEASDFGHALSPEALLALSQALFGRAPHARLVTVTGGDFSLGEGLSKTVEGAVDEAVSLIVDFIHRRDAILRSCP